VVGSIVSDKEKEKENGVVVVGSVVFPIDRSTAYY
jgi:hypothetical protein